VKESLKVELHCHTYHSKDSLMLPDRLLETCRKRGIDRVAITDHNSIEGAIEAAALDPDRVIIGEEIMTTKGEILAFFVQEFVPAGLTPMQTIEQLRDQGAFISVSHPFDSARSGSWTDDDLNAILPYVDAIETMNARTWSQTPNTKAAKIAAQFQLPGTAGSDAHAYAELGRVSMQLPGFDDVAGFRSALPRAHIIGRRSFPLVHFYSRYATWMKAAGWKNP
jgi:predicted metal-dependent phosphoesterase TrpH